MPHPPEPMGGPVSVLPDLNLWRATPIAGFSDGRAVEFCAAMSMFLMSSAVVASRSAYMAHREVLRSSPTMSCGTSPSHA